jgi:hypothetical protein
VPSLTPTVGRATAWTRLLSLVLSLTVLLLAVAPVAATSIQTDLWVYAQGDTVNMYGDGFGASEDVQIVTTDPYGVVVDDGITTSDPGGYIAYSFVLNSDVPGIYDVVATGLSSGLTASTQFDPNQFLISYGQSPDPIQYSDVTTLSGSVTCNHTGGGAVCPSDLGGSSVLVELNQGGGFSTIATATSSSGSSAPWSATWQVNVLPGGPYASRATASGGAVVGTASNNDALTVQREDTAVSYGGGLSGTEFTSLSLSAVISDSDLSKIYPDANLAGASVVTFQLRNTADTANIGSAITADIDSFGATIGSLSLTLPAASGSPYKLRTTYAGNGYYSGNSSLATIVVGSSNTPPSVSISGVSDGSSYVKGAVPVAICDVTDAEDGNSSFAATLTSITGPDAAFGIGSQTADCSYTDAGGLTDTASATYSITDGTAPSISYVLTPASTDGDNGWYLGHVTLVWTVEEGDSPSTLVLTGCDDQDLTADQGAVTYSCSATSAGGNAGPVDVTIKIDGTDPEISISHTADGDNGWNVNDPVGEVISASDATSGVESVDCYDDLTLLAVTGAEPTYGASVTGEGTHPLSCAATDEAGNTSGDTDIVKIDTLDPTISISHTADGDNGWNVSDPVSEAIDASDGTSGVASVDCLDGLAVLAVTGAEPTYSASVSGEGTHELSCTATDAAGNTSGSDADTVMIDTVRPDADVTGVTDGQIVLLGDPLPAVGCDTTDATSGVATNATLSTDDQRNVNGVGPVEYTCSGHEDNAGNLGLDAVETLYVSYDLSDISGILQPINPDNSSLFSRGKAVPVKFRINGDEPLGFNTAGWTLVRMTAPCDAVVDSATLESVSSVTPSSIFRYDAAADQYIYNADFRNKAAGTCWKVRVILDDGVLDLSTPENLTDYLVAPTSFDSAWFKLQK